MARSIAHCMRLVSGTLLPLALVTGLLTFPTSCRCGAALPHEHSIFALDDHAHHSHVRALAPQLELADVASAVLQQTAGTTISTAAALLPIVEAGWSETPGIQQVSSDDAAIGRVLSPEPPPPRG